MKNPRPPVTDSIEELARFWDTHDATDFDDEFEEVTEPVFERKARIASDLTSDVTQALRDTENSLRDFIALVLQGRFGDDWVGKSGLSPERIQNWRERRTVETKRQRGGAVEERLIYYADFYDLPVLLRKNWSGEFSEALGDLKTFEVWLKELERLRDPEAHRRELLPHQKHLILGIAGEIRGLIVRYRSKLETREDYFPRIESARDNYGNMWTTQTFGKVVFCEIRLRPGDQLDYVITAQDPLGEKLEYGLSTSWGKPRAVWSRNNSLSIVIERADVMADFGVTLHVRSEREYHAAANYDDSVRFVYDVLPPRTLGTDLRDS